MNSMIKAAGIISASLLMTVASAQMTDSEGGATTDTMSDAQTTENLRSQKAQRFPGTQMDQKGSDSSQVRDVQSALSSRGYDLEVDGIAGKNTKNALRTFQKDQGLEETGMMDEATLNALNLDGESDRAPASVTEDPGMSNDPEAPVSTDTDTNTDSDY
jgi:peptidoglycan hydrolase-like protein with peptidoglycan-binding domain